MNRDYIDWLETLPCNRKPQKANQWMSEWAPLPEHVDLPRYEEMSQDPLIGNIHWCCTPFSESFGIKDFFREGPVSRSRWLQKVVVCAPNAY